MRYCDMHKNPSASKDNESTKFACILCCLYGVSQDIEVQAKVKVKGSTISRKTYVSQLSLSGILRVCFTDFLCSVLLTGSDKKVEYNLLRTRTISTDDIISPNFKIYALNGGKEYRVSNYCLL